MVIRELRTDEFEFWRELWNAYLDFYEVSVTPDVYEILWNRLHLEDEYEPRAFVAESNGRLVGLTHFLLQRHAWRIEKVTYISDIFVDPNQRGKRIGESLLKAVYERADTLKAPYVYWATDRDNATARKLYDRCGFQTKSILYRRTENRI
jgi:GNAT superfamily N-acetyltransferase